MYLASSLDRFARIASAVFLTGCIHSALAENALAAEHESPC